MTAGWLFLLSSLLAAESGLDARLLEHVKRIAAAPREERGRAVQERLRRLEIPFTAEAFDGGENIEARFEAAAAAAPGRLLILGAHFDRVAAGEGAVDNGASCGVLLEVARALKASPPPAEVRLLFFDREEEGLRGSKAFVQKNLVELKRPGAVSTLNLDVNAFGETLFFGPLDGRQGTIAAILALAAERRGLERLGSAFFPPGDDLSFSAAGVDTVSSSILPRAEAQGVADYLSRRSPTPPGILRLIHSQDDRLARVDPQAMVKVYELMLEVIRLCGRKMERF
ncbi:MAG: M28 family peptidase [Planctomycetes bacterium]|nr:M28 family peptidase [Planctomycetota bacterium]